MPSKFARKLSQTEKDQLAQHLRAGVETYPVIAARFGVSAWTISQWAVKLGLRRGRGPLSPTHPMHGALKSKVKSNA